MTRLVEFKMEGLAKVTTPLLFFFARITVTVMEKNISEHKNDEL